MPITMIHCSEVTQDEIVKCDKIILFKHKGQCTP